MNIKGNNVKDEVRKENSEYKLEKIQNGFQSKNNLQMTKKKKSRFDVKDFIIIPLMAALGIGSKQIILPALSFFLKPINIPGGSVAGGLYMMWLILARELTKKNGAGILTAIIQTFMILMMPFGSQGIFSFITYSCPGIAVDIVSYIMHKIGEGNYIGYYFAGAAANITGTYLVNIVILDLPYILLIIVITISFISGGMGGLISRGIVIEYEKLSKVQILTPDKDEKWYDLALDKEKEIPEKI